MTLLSQSLPDVMQLRGSAARVELSIGLLCVPPHLAVTPAEARAVAAVIERLVRAVIEWSGQKNLPLFDVLIDEGLHTPMAFPRARDPVVVLPLSSFEALRARGEELEPNLVHEVAHVALYTARSPLFAEGWAVACSYALSAATFFPFPLGGDRPSLHAAVAARADDDFALRDYLRGGRRYDDFTVREAPSEANRLAYGRAGSFVQHLIAAKGVAAFVAMAEAFNADPARGEEAALLEHFGASIDDLEAAWRDRAQIPRGAAETSGAPRDAADERAKSFAIAGIDGWTLWTDTVMGGNTSATIAPEDDGFLIQGKLGNRGPFQFAGAMRFLYGKPAPEELVACKGLRFEARGDGKNYQICVSTRAACEPGKEFIYLLATRPEWTAVTIPLGHFSRFAEGGERLRGEDIVALTMRAFGYRNQSVLLAVRNIELFL